MSSRVAVVTGSNKGIGLQVVKELATKFEGLVYLTSRDEGRGKEALQALQASLAPDAAGKLRFHQLDIDTPASVAALAAHLKDAHGRLDVLVNNAGIAYKQDSTAPFAEQAKVTNETNFFATAAVCDALFPLLAPGARVVNVASRVGTITIRNCQPEMREKFSKAASEAEVKELMRSFVTAAVEGRHKELGFPETAYGMSKLGLIALSELQGKALAAKGQDILLNACCPGFVATDMSSHKGVKTVEEGADTLVWLAILPPNDANNPSAQFVGERKVIDWRLGQTREEAFPMPKQ